MHFGFLPPGKTINKEYYWVLWVSFARSYSSKEAGMVESTLGICTTIMHRLIMHWFFITISPKTRTISFHNQRIHLIDTVRLLAIQQTQKTAPRTSVRVERWESKTELKAILEIDNNCIKDWKMRSHKCIISGRGGGRITLKAMKLIWKHK